MKQFKLSYIEINDKQQTINESMLKWIHSDVIKKRHITTNAVISIKYLYELTIENRSVSQIITREFDQSLDM
jgi:hypothetical protein